jgi:2-dehydropantoate 2-reductase
VNIAIIGAGALGSLFGGLLARTGQTVWLYNPSNVEHIQAIRSQGLLIETLKGDTFCVQVPATPRIEEIPKPVQLVGVFVKAYNTQEALEQVRPLIGEHTWVLSLQNGVGVEELLLKYAPKGRALRGVTAQGATLAAPGRVKWAGRGPTRLGPLEPEALDARTRRELEQIVQLLDDAGLDAQYEPDVERVLWEKLLVNVAINPLTALTGVPNGRLIEDLELRAILHDVVREGLPIVQAHGVTLTLEEAIARVENVCRATAENLSSMLQDVRRGRPTEIDFISGPIVREGERLKIPTPLSRLLWQLVRARSGRLPQRSI